MKVLHIVAKYLMQETNYTKNIFLNHNRNKKKAMTSEIGVWVWSLLLLLSNLVVGFV